MFLRSKDLRREAAAGPIGVIRIVAVARKAVKRKSTSAKRRTSGASQSGAKREKAVKKKAAKKTTVKAAARGKKATASGARKSAARGARASKPAGSAASVEAALLEARPVRKRESKLSSRDVEQFRQMLLQKRAEILGDVSTLHDEALNKNRTDAAGDLSSMPIHMADLGTDNYELEFTLGLIEGERAILKEIDEALDRIKQGTYGNCLATGQPIGKARLRAKPWAKYCYEYTLAQERGQAREL